LALMRPPILPFEAVYLGDLSYIEEMPTMLDKDMINFEKMRLLGHIISSTEIYQKCLYCYEVVPQIADYLQNKLPVLTEDELYDRAKLCEDGTPTITRKRSETETEKIQKKKSKKILREISKKEKQFQRTMSATDLIHENLRNRFNL